MTEFDLWTPPATATPIWESQPPGFDVANQQPAPTITPFLAASGASNPAVIVLPGGGYEVKAGHEAAPVAEWLNQIGISAFVLDYRVAPYRQPVPLLDARRAIQFVRSRSADWSIDPRRIGVLGFSAGGHLASTVGTHFEAVHWPEDAVPQDAVAQYSFRPDALILCYPVITFGPYAHTGSMENLLGSGPSQELRDAFSNEKQVTSQTPPTFLWTTASDAAVPVENSLLFAAALSANHVPFDLHIFASGEHGAGLAQAHPYAEPWTDLCARWLHNIGF